MSQVHSKPVAQVIAAVDGSRPADVAATMAAEIAHAQKYAFYGIYVVDETLVLDPYASYKAEVHINDTLPSREEIMAALESHGNATLEKIGALCEGLKIPHREEILFGNVVDLVTSRAREGILLALGRRGNRHTGHVLGQHVGGILHHAPTSLLIGGERIVRLDNILVAYNGSPSARYALQWAYTLQRALDVRVHILTVVEHNDEQTAYRIVQDALAHIAAPDREQYEVHVLPGTPGATMTQLAERLDVGLIMIGRHRRSPISQWWKGSTLEYVLRHSERAVFLAY